MRVLGIGFAYVMHPAVIRVVMELEALLLVVEVTYLSLRLSYDKPTLLHCNAPYDSILVMLRISVER